MVNTTIGVDPQWWIQQQTYTDGNQNLDQWQTYGGSGYWPGGQSGNVIPYAPQTQTGTSTWITQDTFKYDPPVDITEHLANIKAVEELKKEHKLEDFHIAVENPSTYFQAKYVFLTDTEMAFLKKYSIPVNEIKDPYNFNTMLDNIKNKSAKLVLAGTCEAYDNLDDLRKDHLILKLSGIKE